MAKKYIAELTPAEREELLTLTRQGETSARKVKRANILLLADKGCKDIEIAAALHTSVPTVERTRKRFVLEGLRASLNERPRPGAKCKLDAKGEAILETLAQSKPPGGRKRWTLQLLADRLVELKVVDSISDETVRKHLHKKRLKPWVEKKWCIPTVGAEFVWRMEDVLDLYAEPEDPRRPRVCFDEMPYQLVAEKRIPLPMQSGKPRRYDYEYRRMGTCNLFLFFNPFTGWRHLKVTEQRTKQDFAHCMKELVDVHFPQAEVIRVVLDQLNTHTYAALYETFEPEEARRIIRKLEFHYTPKHGSWLNMAEIEFSVLERQCLNRYLASITTLAVELAAWETPRNEQKIGVDWQFTTEKARQKLQRLYPSIS